MNKPIKRLFVVVMVMFAALVGQTTWWTVVKSDDLATNYPKENQRAVLRGLKVRRGTITAADGTVLARSVRDDEGNYSRRYPAGSLFAHAVGYSYTGFGQAGLERYENDDLTGQQQNGTGTLISELLGRSQAGDRVRTTLDPKLQQAAATALGARKGSVVALDPRTGAIKAMVNYPSFDAGSFRQEGVFSRLNRDNDGSPLLNRATLGGYVPGSTMKVVTAVAAIDSGKFTPQSVVDGSNDQVFSGTNLANFGGEDFPGVDLTTALTQSVNTAWANVAESVGASTYQRYMDRFGFGSKPPLDYPSDQLLASGEYSAKGTLLKATSPQVDLARLAIGQDKLRVTPLQMAQVAAAVANGGRLMKPRLVDQVVDPDGRVTRDEPEEQSRVMSAQTASEVLQMMANVVREGSGTAAALQGIQVAGKTGTAEKNIAQRLNQAWFIGIAPVESPRLVVAATVEDAIGGQGAGGTGGVVAAPIAKAVLQAGLGG